MATIYRQADLSELGEFTELVGEFLSRTQEWGEISITLRQVPRRRGSPVMGVIVALSPVSLRIVRTDDGYEVEVVTTSESMWRDATNYSSKEEAVAGMIRTIRNEVLGRIQDALRSVGLSMGVVSHLFDFGKED